MCEGQSISEKCTAPLAFTTEGFTETEHAARGRQRDRGRSLEDRPSDGRGARRRRLADRLDRGSRPHRRGSSRRRSIAVVLVFDGVAPEDLPATADHLADFGVDLVYVSQRLEIVVPR